ncbi:MAG: TolC family protein [Magnetococcales bacterium]|nr:TolC family protein [Magnetococcales bacterium]
MSLLLLMFVADVARAEVSATPEKEPEIVCVQTASTRSLTQLRFDLKKIRDKGFSPAVLEKLGTNGESWFCSQIGCFKRFKDARKLAQRYSEVSQESPLLTQFSEARFELYRERWNSRLEKLVGGSDLPVVPELSQYLASGMVPEQGPQAEAVGESEQKKSDTAKPVEAGMKPEKEEKPVFSGPVTKSMVPAMGSFPSEETGVEREVVLEIPHLVAQIVAQNVRVQMSRLDQDVARLAINQSKSVFETILSASASFKNGQSPNSNEEKASRNNRDEFIEYARSYTIGVEKMLSTGLVVELSGDVQRTNNNILDVGARSVEHEVTTGVTLTQPLLKGRGKDATMAEVWVAQEDVRISLQEFRRILMDQIYQGLLGYWDLHQAQEILANRDRSVQIVQTLLEDDQKRFDLGKGRQRAVMETEVVLAKRQAAKQLAIQGVWEAINRLREKLMLLPHESPVKLTAAPVTMQEAVKRSPDVFLERLKRAFAQRPEYVSQLSSIKQAGIRLAYSEDQRLPQIDLEASYSRSGIDRDFRRAFREATSDSFKAFSVGINFSTPLGRDLAADSSVQAAKSKKRRALLALKEMEVSIATALDSALRNVENADLRLDNLKKAEELTLKLYTMEKKQFELGQSNSRTVLQLEEALNGARQETLEAEVALQKALIHLQLVEGSLLETFNLELR